MSEEEKQYFFNFSFFKIDPKWRWMADLAKEESARELENIIENSPVNIRSYSTLGLRDGSCPNQLRIFRRLFQKFT